MTFVGSFGTHLVKVINFYGKKYFKPIDIELIMCYNSR